MAIENKVTETLVIKVLCKISVVKGKQQRMQFKRTTAIIWIHSDMLKQIDGGIEVGRRA